MSQNLDGLTEPQFSFLADLMVRVGIFVSHCEDTDLDEHSENMEAEQLSRALLRISKVAKYPLVSALAQEALKRTSAPHADNEEKLSLDLQQSVAVLLQMDEPDKLLEYRKALMYVATSVARAYREELDHHEEEFMMETFMNKITGILNKTISRDDFKNLNISPTEDTALTMISEALKV